MFFFFFSLDVLIVFLFCCTMQVIWKSGEVGLKKLFVCDFDGTLYKKNNKRQFESAMEEVKRLKSGGYEFVFAPFGIWSMYYVRKV